MSGFVVSASLEDFHLLENDVDAPDNSPRPECSQLTKREEEFGGFLIRGRRYKHLQASENVQLEYCVEKPQQIGKNRLLQVLCGLLNTSSSGWLHYGVQAGGRVMGLCMDRTDRDALRTGLDEAVSSFEPPLAPQLYQCQFSPVVKSDSSSYIPAKHKFFVFSVFFRNPGEVYVLRRSMQCFGRVLMRTPSGCMSSGNKSHEHITVALGLSQVRQLTCRQLLEYCSHRDTSSRDCRLLVCRHCQLPYGPDVNDRTAHSCLPYNEQVTKPCNSFKIDSESDRDSELELIS